MSFNKHQWADWVRDKQRSIGAALGAVGLVIVAVLLNLAILAAGVWVVVWVLQSTGVL